MNPPKTMFLLSGIYYSAARVWDLGEKGLGIAVWGLRPGGSGCHVRALQVV